MQSNLCEFFSCLRELEDDDEATHMLREVRQFHQNIGYYHAVGHL